MKRYLSKYFNETLDTGVLANPERKTARMTERRR